MRRPSHLELLVISFLYGEAKDERNRLKEVLALNASLAAAYYLKEDLRQFWNQTTYQRAKRFLDLWCARAEASGIRRLQKLANTLRGHRTGLLNWYLYPISTGPLEGTNTKIRVMQRQAYGFRDQEFFQLKIYQLHETKDWRKNNCRISSPLTLPSPSRGEGTYDSYFFANPKHALVG